MRPLLVGVARTAPTPGTKELRRSPVTVVVPGGTGRSRLCRARTTTDVDSPPSSRPVTDAGCVAVAGGATAAPVAAATAAPVAAATAAPAAAATVARSGVKRVPEGG